MWGDNGREGESNGGEGVFPSEHLPRDDDRMTGPTPTPFSDALEGEFLEEEQLTLADEDEQLPWLEAEEDYYEEGVSTGKLIGMALLGLIAVAALVGAMWWFSKDRGGDATAPTVAKGGTIEAPDTPIKARPSDPGGAEVAGTGDVSYKVGEGKTAEGVVKDSGPRPGIDRNQTGSSASAGTTGASATTVSATATTPGSASSAASGSVGVQVGAYSTRASAEKGWSQLSGRYSALSGVSHRIVEGTIDSGTIYRLQAVAGSGAAADALCRSIRTQGGDCQVKR